MSKINIDPSVFIDDYNNLIYIIQSTINSINTLELVQVKSVNDDKTLDVIPIVKNVTTENKPIDESIIYGIRYLQWQYGSNMIKAVPEIGDIGLLLVCKKDISEVEKGLVGSFRKFNLADGIYIGGVYGLNPAPIQKIEFKGSSINITSGTELNITSPQTNINGSLNVSTGASGLVYTGTQVLTFTNGILTNIS